MSGSPKRLEIFLFGLAAASRVRPDCGPAETVFAVSRGSTAVKVMPRPARFASSWAYPVMKRWVALAPAYPPLRGDPATAAPLLMTITRLPGRSGFSSASRNQWNAILTSVLPVDRERLPRLVLQRAHSGLAPATRTTACGS